MLICKSSNHSFKTHEIWTRKTNFFTVHTKATSNLGRNKKYIEYALTLTAGLSFSYNPAENVFFFGSVTYPWIILQATFTGLNIDLLSKIRLYTPNFLRTTQQTFALAKTTWKCVEDVLKISSVLEFFLIKTS